MEAVAVPYKQVNTPKRNSNSCSNSISRPTANFSPSNFYGGLSFYPRSPHHLSPSLSLSQYPHVHPLPPLLPLPIHHLSLPSQSRDFPSSPHMSARKAIKSRDKSLTPKKSKSAAKSKDLKLNLDLSRIISPPSSLLSFLGKDSSYVEELEKFSGSLFNLSPHPSSLPLPKFSIRSNHKCHVEAIDAGATDNLRRLLRLR